MCHHTTAKVLLVWDACLIPFPLRKGCNTSSQPSRRPGSAASSLFPSQSSTVCLWHDSPAKRRTAALKLSVQFEPPGANYGPCSAWPRSRFGRAQVQIRPGPGLAWPRSLWMHPAQSGKFQALRERSLGARRSPGAAGGGPLGGRCAGKV